MGAQRLQQNFPVLPRHRVVERALPRRLGQQFGDAPFKIGLDVANALRLALERLGRMQERIVIELDEWLERDAEPATIIQDRVMVMGNAPRPGVEIEAGVEFAALGLAAELGIDVAAPQRPVPAAGARVVFEDLDLVAGPLKLDRRGHSGQARPQHDDRGPFRIAFELDPPAVRRRRRQPKLGHRLIHRRPAGGRSDQREQAAPGQRSGRLIAHRLAPLSSRDERRRGATGSSGSPWRRE